MTIAIGLLCENGVILAADTGVAREDGSKTETRKVVDIATTSGAFAVANSAEDGHAAKTLVSHLVADIKGNDIDSLASLEGVIADRMTQWASAFSKVPSVQLILAARLHDRDERASLVSR
jgi:hypothetical protein